MEKLFSYGTLQQENVQIETFNRKLEGKKDTLLGYCLSEVEIRDKEVIKASGSNIHPILRLSEMDQEIEGTVFYITEEELHQADEYEVDEYKRVSVELKSGEITWVYVASDESFIST